jgi:hypothetical protein
MQNLVTGVRGGEPDLQIETGNAIAFELSYAAPFNSFFCG